MCFKRKIKSCNNIKFLTAFEKNQKIKSQNKFILLSSSAKEYNQFVESDFSISHFNTIQTAFKKLFESIGDMLLKKLQIEHLKRF
jgi:uncharacterized protein YeeX (DUF496 family)